MPPNPDPAAFEPELIKNLFAELNGDRVRSRAALNRVPAGTEVSLEIDLRDPWFDVNMNKTRDAAEGVLALAAHILTPRAGFDADETPEEQMVVRFDTADVAWLRAYTHLLSGIGELVVAFDPTGAIAEVMASKAAKGEIQGNFPLASPWERKLAVFIDQFAMVYGALNHKPVATRTQAARAQLLAMIDANMTFWEAVSKETDNDAEWIPNTNPTAALGFALPEQTGEVWQSVLAVAQAVLNGELLVPFWRLGPAGGVNVKKLFLDPPAADIVTWVQDAGLLPYLERGRRFRQKIRGSSKGCLPVRRPSVRFCSTEGRRGRQSPALFKLQPGFADHVDPTQAAANLGFTRGSVAIPAVFSIL